MEQENFMSWKAACVECGRELEKSQGIFCGNFLLKRGGFDPCMYAVCGGCYKQHPRDNYATQKELDEDEAWVTDERLGDRFKCGRNGDHLMGIPFECDLCHFRNLNGRDPCASLPKDNYTLLAIRRASLDAFWSRETSTVTGNLSRLIKDYTASMNAYSMMCPLPVLGNPKLEDRVGMSVALMMLEASTRGGRYGPNLQYDSTRRTLTVLHNAYLAGEKASTSEVLTNQETNFHVVDAPFASRWRERFSLGVKRRMGVFRKQNEPLTMKLLLEILRTAEEDWKAARSEREKKHIEEFACYMIVGYMLSLRGEEVPLVSLTGLIEYWSEGRQPVDDLPPHVMIPLQGRFKGEQNTRWHLVPIADKSRSKVPARRWLSRLVLREMRGRRVTGPLFAKANGKKAAISDYDTTFRSYLGKVRLAKGDLYFHKGARIEDYSLRRSLRRGSTSHATNQSVPPQVIDEINRWRKKEAARGGAGTFHLRQVYTTVIQTLPARLKYSQML